MKGDRKLSYVFPRNFKISAPRITRGEGIFLYDEEGNAYLDAAAGALSANIGYGVKEVAEAIARQTEAVPFAHGFTWDTSVTEEAAAMIVELAPPGMDRVWFVNSGSEAMEAAIKMARQYYLERDGLGSVKHLVIGRQNSYHGSSLGTLAIGGSVPRRKLFLPMLHDHPKIETHYCYRCPYGLERPACGTRCAYDLEKTIRRIGAQYIAAFVAEPIVGSTVGALVPPDDYWPVVRDICSRNDILLIADEVMTGCGRTGANFCVDHWKTVPDLVAAAKGLAASYYPAGAVLVSSFVAEAFGKGSGFFAHSHTFNGMPAASAAIVAVLRYMKEHGLVENAAKLGRLVENELAPEIARSPLVGEMRGKGLMWGIELVADKESKAPFPGATSAANRLKAICQRRGMTVYPGKGMIDGVLGDNIMIGPPLTVTEEQVRRIFSILEDSLEELAETLA